MTGKPLVVSTTNMDAIRQSLNEARERIIEELIGQLDYIGLTAVKLAREQGAYNNITGNLRSSIGYTVLRDGRTVRYGAPAAAAGPNGDGAEGTAAGAALLRQLTAEYPEGLVLIVSAGMHYAVYVEHIHHLDVLSSAELLAEKLVRELVDKINATR